MEHTPNSPVKAKRTKDIPPVVNCKKNKSVKFKYSQGSWSVLRNWERQKEKKEEEKAEKEKKKKKATIFRET